MGAAHPPSCADRIRPVGTILLKSNVSPFRSEYLGSFLNRPYVPIPLILAQVSRSPTVRLNINRAGVLSGSRQK
jgi:hypothetical protein